MNTCNNKNEQLKDQVKAYWNRASCGTGTTQQQKFSQIYFEEIEQHRYTMEADIFALAQFTRFHGKKVLEVGVGAGTDFLQWVRAGAHAHGIDLTQEAIDNVHARLEAYGLKAADVRVADAEALPYPNNYFDCVYSWGVIHHSPDMEQCLREIIRVTKPGGTAKLMVYNRHSLWVFCRYFRSGVLRGKPFQSFAKILFYNLESLGTKAYTRSEIKKMMEKYPVIIKQLKAPVTQRDLLWYKRKPFQWLAYLAACVCGMNKVGWFMTIELTKQEEVPL
jgi:ubiquinone/menaquinone biosynthesis C-methylase UbiE